MRSAGGIYKLVAGIRTTRQWLEITWGHPAGTSGPHIVESWCSAGCGLVLVAGEVLALCDLAVGFRRSCPPPRDDDMDVITGNIGQKSWYVELRQCGRMAGVK